MNVRVTAGLVGIAFLGIVLALVAAWRTLDVAPAVTGPLTPVSFRVEPGEGFAGVAARLEEAGLVLSARRLRILARVTGSDRDVRAGTYSILPGVRPRQLLRDLVDGNVRLTRFTVPEGWRLARIAEEAERALGVSAESFLDAAQDPTALASLGTPGPTLEGYLFPETYHFPDGVGAVDVRDAMTRRFLEVWDSLAALAEELPEEMDRHEAVTLASIVEAETARESEKPRIAAVYLNRLQEGWKLQADPTVRYGIERFTGRLYYKHLDIESPYNTYRNHGLPPGPIGSPGRASLAAVLDPLEPCEDFYFVASGDGGHVFSRTRAEHVRAKAMARSGAFTAAEAGSGAE